MSTEKLRTLQTRLAEIFREPASSADSTGPQRSTYFDEEPDLGPTPVHQALVPAPAEAENLSPSLGDMKPLPPNPFDEKPEDATPVDAPPEGDELMAPAEKTDHGVTPPAEGLEPQAHDAPIIGDAEKPDQDEGRQVASEQPPPDTTFDTGDLTVRAERAKSQLAGLGLDTAIRLRWAMRDIRGKRTKLSPVRVTDLATLTDFGLVEMREGIPRLTSLGVVVLD